MGRNYKHLTIEERTMLQTRLAMGEKSAAIAVGLNRSPATLSRELRRNGWTGPNRCRGSGRPAVSGGYGAEAAHQRAHAYTVKPRVEKRLQPGTALWGQVVHYLQAGYSPEQVAGTRASVHPDTPSLQVSHATLYTAIYAMPRGELRTTVIGGLRFGHAKRRPRARGEDRRGKIPDRVSIHDRPPEVEEWLVPGHWEGDLIKGAYNRSSVGTLVPYPAQNQRGWNKSVLPSCLHLTLSTLSSITLHFLHLGLETALCFESGSSRKMIFSRMATH